MRHGDVAVAFTCCRRRSAGKVRARRHRVRQPGSEKTASGLTEPSPDYTHRRRGRRNPPAALGAEAVNAISQCYKCPTTAKPFRLKDDDGTTQSAMHADRTMTCTPHLDRERRAPRRCVRPSSTIRPPPASVLLHSPSFYGAPRLPPRPPKTRTRDYHPLPRHAIPVVLVQDPEPAYGHPYYHEQ
ncbi:hypothetical protein DFH06DRAFT_1258665 [Mycena polygramma]|nr:hypothetical protein DFH06DRAFT_1258665 [Mycena polygramma]